MKLPVILLIIVLIFLCVYIAWGSCAEQGTGETEGYRRWGRHGGYHGGWGYWGSRYAWPYYAGLYSSWPPYLYGYGVPRHYGPRCVDSNQASDCEPLYPHKVGTDTDGDGVKDSWKCCRR